MTDRRSPLLPAAAMVMCATVALSSAFAQESYTLGEDDQWRLESAPDPSTPEGQLAIAQKVLAEGDHSRAYDLADDWIETHETHPMLPVAYLVRGDALYGQGDYYDALFDYESITRVHPGSEVFITALQRELEIAKKFARGLKRKLWGMRIVDASDIAEELLILIQERLPGSNLAEDAGMELGDFYFRRGEKRMAATAYDLFIENYPNSPRITKARERLIAANLATHKGAQWDATGLEDARVQLQRLKAFEPAAAQQLGADGIIAGIDEKIARKRLVTAEYYLRVGDPIAAEYTIRRLVRRYENTLAAAEALRMIPDILDQLADTLRNKVEPFYAEKRAAVLGPAEERSTPSSAESEPAESADETGANDSS